MTGKYVDQMMTALAKKNQLRQQQDALRDPATGEIRSKPRRGTGPVPGQKPPRKASGRGR